MSNLIKELDSENFDDFISKGNCVVDFWAEWCGPCKMLAPILEETAEEMNKNVKFGKVNVDGQQELAERFGIMSIPSLIFFTEGKQVEMNTGFIDKKGLNQMIKSVF